MLKNINESVNFPLSILINRTLNEGQYPDQLKMAKVVPLHKGSNKDLITNYRPISILSSILKVYEKIIFKRLYSYLSSNSILDPLQFGFKPKHSTINAITKLTQDILMGFEDKKVSLAVYCDLSKAFDTIDHSILLLKLQKYGVRGVALDLFSSYLAHRTMYVVNNNLNSDLCEIPNFGVPQGSVLGPLLFNIYVNDLSSCLKHSCHILYADDTTLYIVGTDLRQIFNNMNEDLDCLADWFKANTLLLNINKSNYMLFSQRYIDSTNLKLDIDGVLLKKVNCTKFLGLNMDWQMTWENHIKSLKNKITSGIYILNTLKHNLTTHHLRLIYTVIIQSHLNYGCLLWGNAYKNT